MIINKILDLHLKPSVFEICVTEKKNETYPIYKISKTTLFVQDKVEIFLLISILIYYKQLLVSVELKRSLADYCSSVHKDVFFPPGLSHTRKHFACSSVGTWL